MDPLEFLARVLVHIPDKGHVTTRYYGWYANRPRDPRHPCCGGHFRHRHIHQSGSIAAGFGVASVDSVAFNAGRIALRAVDDCIRRGVDFAFETTLSGRRWPRLLDRLGAAGYDAFLHYLWIPDASQCVARVAHRVSVGGHRVREEDIRRRHASSIENCITMFMPRVEEWFVHDASKSGLNTIASGMPFGLLRVVDTGAWKAFTACWRRDIVREVASHGYLLTPTRERGMNNDERTTKHSDDEAALESLARTSEHVMAVSRIAVRRALAITAPSASGPPSGKMARSCWFRPKRFRGTSTTSSGRSGRSRAVRPRASRTVSACPERARIPKLRDSALTPT